MIDDRRLRTSEWTLRAGRRIVTIIALLAVGTSAGCGATRSDSDAAAPSAPPDLAIAPTPPDLFPPTDLQLGPCAKKLSPCRSDSDCNPPFATCQFGGCCSGKIDDPVSCTCSCNGGPPCNPMELCCTGGRNNGRNVPDLGALVCRNPKDCLDGDDF